MSVLRSEPIPKQPIPTEDKEQMLFVQWFKRTYFLTYGVRIFAIPNGGIRGKSEGAKFKATGVSAGVPDLSVPEWGLWIEMKRRNGGVISDEQKDWHQYLKKIGQTVIIGYGLDDAIDKVLAFRGNR